MNGDLKKILWIITIIYVLSPIDLFPGPIDDILVLIVNYYLTRNGNRIAE
ncbi:MAG: hypothetical protein J5590_07870 [Clostridia bacterium]|nr:hypothetical protein [Clostridia bacterium]